MRRMTLLMALGLLVLAGCAAGRGCRPEPVAATPTPTLPPAPATATSTPVLVRQTPTSTATRTQARPTATGTRFDTSTPVATPTARILTPVPSATPMLLGWHTVARGETMFGIGLVWYAGRYMPWGEDVWRPICEANQDVVTNCRLIFVGQRLRVPTR